MAYSSSNAQARAISHRTWSRKKAPISRVGSYDFNGGVDRATMKMHMSAADRPQGHTQVVTLWPLASTAIDKNECFAVREREVLWTMRPGKGMGRTSDGRMRALSSLNYFRLVLSDDQRDALAAAMGMQGQSPEAVMGALKSLVGPKRMEHPATRVMTLDMLNKVDHLLRSYVLAVIQYAGVAITGEEAGSRQHLQGIAVTVGGLNTLANNSDKTLCPGMKLCMTVPRCVPDSTAWPAPCDHIGLPHGKVVPILRQADGSELSNMIMTQHLDGIYRNVAQLMTGCCSGMQTEVKEEDVPVDVYFIFTKGTVNEHQLNLKANYTSTDKSTTPPEIVNDQLDVMRRMNDAVVFTYNKNPTKLNQFSKKSQNRYKGTAYDPSMHNDGNLKFQIGAMRNAKKADHQVYPLTNQITEVWRLLIIAFGNIRNIVLAAVTGKGVVTSTKSFYSTKLGANVTYASNVFTDLTDANGIQKVFETHFNGIVPSCLNNTADNAADPDAAQYAEMICNVNEKVRLHLVDKGIVIHDSSGINISPNRIAYVSMQAVANGNAAFARGFQPSPHIDVDATDTALAQEQNYQPNIVVLDEKTQYPWDEPHIAKIVNAKARPQHSKQIIVFRKTFGAPMRTETTSKYSHIELSDNELPFVGAWLAVQAGTRDAITKRCETLKNASGTGGEDLPYRSDFMPKRFFVLRKDNVDYYYLTWSAIVHLVCHNVLQQHDNGKKILEMNRATLSAPTGKYYAFTDGKFEPTLKDTDFSGTNPVSRRFGAPGLGSFLHAILRPDTDATTQYQDYLRTHSPIASLVKNVVQATVEAVTQHQLTTEKKTVGMALSSAARGEAVDVVLTGAV